MILLWFSMNLFFSLKCLQVFTKQKYSAHICPRMGLWYLFHPHKTPTLHRKMQSYFPYDPVRHDKPFRYSGWKKSLNHSITCSWGSESAFIAISTLFCDFPNPTLPSTLYFPSSFIEVSSIHKGVDVIYYPLCTRCLRYLKYASAVVSALLREVLLQNCSNTLIRLWTLLNRSAPNIVFWVKSLL